MKILVWSKYGDALSLARLMREKDNNEVVLYVDIDYNKRVGEGIIPKVENWKEYVDWADLIVFDDENQGKYVEELREKGKVVFGTNEFGGRLENDRDYSFDVSRDLGVKTIPYWKFKSLDEGIKFIRENPSRYVFKPFGQRPRYYTKVSEMITGEDLLWFMEYLKKIWKGGQDFILQKYIEGIEVGCCSWFNGYEFLRPFEICFEHKKMKNYGGGGNCGEAGSLIFASPESKIFDEILAPFEEWLKNTKYTGQFYANTKVNDDGIWLLEYVPRLGIPATYLYNELLQERWTDVFKGIATGELKKMPLELGRFVVGVKIDVEPIPDLDAEATYTVPVETPVKFDFDPIGAEAGFFEGDLRKDKTENQYYLTGKQGHVGIVVGSGKTVQEAQDMCYKVVEKIFCPFNITFNAEIGEKYDYVAPYLVKQGIFKV
jgi:phosphoribosylamine--glycine ligase